MKRAIWAGAVMLCLVTGVAEARFVSVDPVQADANNGQNFNRYYYANNNPYKFTDPDGRVVKSINPANNKKNRAVCQYAGKR